MTEHEQGLEQGPEQGPERRPHGVRRRPTVYAVAERAGVSIATVSRALRADGPVAAETRARVLEAARELNWWPSRAAQALAGEAHDAVAIVLPDLAGPYYAQVIAGFESEVVHRGSAVMVLGTHGRAAAEQMVRDLSTRTDGLVIMDQTIPDRTVQQIATSVPVTLLARPALPGVASVRSENTQAALALTRHLFDHGRRRLWFLGDPARAPDIQERWLGFALAHTTGDHPMAPPMHCEGLEAEHGHQAVLELLREDEADAIVCANDELASGVYRAAAETGRTIPGTLAVTGWDDGNLATHLSPRLTTVRQPMRELGATAARLLFQRIEGHETAGLVLDTHLVRRGSCGC